jgi:ribose transport system substrate-binding protein
LALIVIGLLVFWPRGDQASGARQAAAGGVNVEADPNEEYVFIGKSVSNPYWVDAREGLEDRARAIGVRADFRGASGTDVNEQIKQFEDAMARKPAGIIVSPAGVGITPMINRAIDGGIPVICVDSDAPQSKRFSYVGTDNYNAGRQGGELLGKLLNGRGEVFLLSVPGEPNLEDRIRGYRDALAKHPDIKIVDVGNDRADPNEAAKVARNILSAHPNIAGVGCVDAGGGEGTAVVLREKGLVGKVKIVGMDRNEATLSLIEEGVIDASIAQRTYTMAYMALGMLYDLHHNKVRMVDDWRGAGVLPLPTNVDTGTVVITKENVRAFKRKK